MLPIRIEPDIYLLGGFSYHFLVLTVDCERVGGSCHLQVDIRLNAYREHYQNVSLERIIAMVAYQFALENLQLKDRNDTEPYTAKIKELTEVLETYFKEQ